MTDPISFGPQTLILVGMALLAVLLVQVGRWLGRARARTRASILRAQEDLGVVVGRVPGGIPGSISMQSAPDRVAAGQRGAIGYYD